MTTHVGSKIPSVYFVHYLEGFFFYEALKVSTVIISLVKSSCTEYEPRCQSPECDPGLLISLIRILIVFHQILNVIEPGGWIYHFFMLKFNDKTIGWT